MNRDPWTAGGLALLAVLTLLVLLLYRSAPQSVAEASAAGWLVARPNAVAPLLARARERLAYGGERLAAGDDSLAMAADSVAAEAAWRARTLAATAAERSEATALWAEGLLGTAEVLRRRGTGSGLHPDDNGVLRRGLALVERTLSVPLEQAQRARAQALRDQITRTLRPGPLEWLPQPR